MTLIAFMDIVESNQSLLQPAMLNQIRAHAKNWSEGVLKFVAARIEHAKITIQKINDAESKVARIYRERREFLEQEKLQAEANLKLSHAKRNI